jgi:hypothetical protein
MRPVDACGPERVSTRPIFKGAAWTLAPAATKEANTMFFALEFTGIRVSIFPASSGW